MKRKRILASLLTAAIVASTVLTGCGGGKQDKNQAVLNLDSPDIKTLDSALGQDSASFNAMNSCFEGLLRANNDKPEAAGAEKFEVSQDGKTYTFHLRDHQWSDGKKVTAQDYEYAWKRLLNPKTKSPYAFFLMGVKNADKYYKGEAKEKQQNKTKQ